jgi:hypothetical protein
VRYQFFWVPVLFAVATNDGVAKCVSRPNIRADVLVQSCVAVTFGPSNLREEVPDGPPLPWYKPGLSYSGSLLAAVVISSHFDWGDGAKHITNGAHLWTRGDMLSFFVDKPPSEACPAIRNKPITIETDYDCCDTWPVEGKCLVPQSIMRVSVVSS